MIVVADTSPINYLILIGEIELSRRLFTRVALPPAVVAELTARRPARRQALGERAAGLD